MPVFVVAKEDEEEIWLDATHDPDTAAQLLARVAAYLEAHEPVPTQLASFVARAFRATANTKREYRVRKLSYHLGLAGHHKRKAVSTIRVGEFIAAAMSGDRPLSQTKAIAAACKKFNIKTSTARDHWAQYEQARHPVD